MAMLSFAFSVHNFISSVGADAGFAAIIGLAILVLLYFAHARETANLREEAALLTQRLQQAEARVVQLSRTQPATATVDAAEEGPAEAELATFAPAGMAAPALGAATRVIPVALPAAEPAAAAPASEPAAAPVPAMAMAMAGVAASAAAASPVAAPPAPAATAPVEVDSAVGPEASAARVAPSPPPATSPAAPAAEPSGPTAPPVPAPATQAGGGGNGAGHQLASPQRAPAGPGFSARQSTAGSRPLSGRQLPPLRPPKRRRSRLGRGVAVAMVALAAVAVAVGLFALTSVGGSAKHSSSTPTTNVPSVPASGIATTFKPSSVTVAVLNGTTTNQLAHRIADKLAAYGYKEGTIATAANQTATKTVVGYRKGATNRTDAVHVAQALGLRSSAVQAVDQGTLQVACPASSACTANVVVTVGADLANQ